MSEQQNNKVFYDPDADVFSWEVNERPIAYAREMGNVVVHFTENHVPALIEVLEAGRYAKGREKKELPFPGPVPAA